MNSSSSFYDETLDLPLQQDVARALAEDLGTGDLTASLVPADAWARAYVMTREPAVLCGAPWVLAASRAIDPSMVLTWQVAEGQACIANQRVLDVQGPARSVLSLERTALNFLQMLSAVATKTAHYVAAAQGTRARIVDTRKTLPGLRLAQKYAVRVGGGLNHRIGLFDAVLIKENHIAAAGGIGPVLRRAREAAARATFVEIEVETLDQLREALHEGAEMILLDNMDLDTLHQAVAINEQWSRETGRRPAVLEISGGVTLGSIRALALTGVDRISVGALTKDIQAIDFSMRFEPLH